MNKDQIINFISTRLHELISMPVDERGAARDNRIEELSHILRQITNDGPSIIRNPESNLHYITYDGAGTVEANAINTLSSMGSSSR